jgi:oligoendopeptidase F
MTQAVVPPRSEIDPQFTWNAANVFASDAAWEAEARALGESLPEIKQYEGRLGESATLLLQVLQTAESLLHRADKLELYAGMAHSVETTNQAAAAMVSRAQSIKGRTHAAVAFIMPEILALGDERIRQWLAENESLAVYGHYLDNLFRLQAHIRSVEVEEVLGMLADPFAGVANTESMLTDADFKFRPAVGGDGRELDLTQSSIDDHMANPDRDVRRTAWEHYCDTYLAFKNTLASNLVTSIKQNVFLSRVRRQPSTLQAALFADNIPPEVFHNLLDVFRRNLPTWHRYWQVRRQALGVDALRPYDIWAPLVEKVDLPYEQAVDWVCRGMAPLGENYVAVMERGLRRERWVDVFPNQGKRAGAFSWGAPGTHPFIVMSYTRDVYGLSTLAHELGHSMHSYHAWQSQPLVYTDYSLFAAEVASNFNQALVRAHLLATNPDPNFQIQIIEEAMANFHRYFFIMPTLARFELELHERVERGEGVTADVMNALMTALFQEGYGGEMEVDADPVGADRVGITWAQFGHLYADYYVFQYATGISAAHALARPILDGKAGAVEAYLDFLRAGGSRYPLEALQEAGVDLTTPAPVEETFAVLSQLVDRLEQLL